MKQTLTKKTQQMTTRQLMDKILLAKEEWIKEVLLKYFGFCSEGCDEGDIKYVIDNNGLAIRHKNIGNPNVQTCEFYNKYKHKVLSTFIIHWRHPQELTLKFEKHFF